MEYLNTFMDLVGWELLGTLLLGVFTYVGVQLKALYEKTVNTKEKQDTVNFVVSAIEQLAKINGWDGEQKKAQAVAYAVQILTDKGVAVSELELELLIESAVNGLKTGFNQKETTNTGYNAELEEALKNGGVQNDE